MIETNRKRLRNFGLALGIVFLVFGIRLTIKWHNPNYLFLLAPSAFFVFTGFRRPFILGSTFTVFERVARFIIEQVITKLALTLTFYLVFAPAGLLIKLMRRDLLGLNIDRKIDSYWMKREDRAGDLKQYEKQF